MKSATHRAILAGARRPTFGMARVAGRLAAFFREGRMDGRATIEPMEAREMLSAPPTVAAVLPNVTMTVGEPSVQIELSNYFADDEQAGSELVYTLAEESNPLASLVTLTGTTLDLSTRPMGFGDSQITLRATDSEGLFVETSFKMSVKRKSASVLAPAGPSVIGNQTIEGTQTPGGIAYLADGSFVMVWDGPGTGGVTGVWARRFDSQGAALTDEFAISSTGGTGSRISASAEGGFLVTWETGEVYGQLYDASASKVGLTFQVNSYTTSTQNHNSATYLADGSFVVTWTSVGQSGGSTGVYARHFDAQGEAISSEFLVGLGIADTFADVSANPGGGYGIIWDNALTSDKGQIFLQRYTGGDAKAGALVVVSQTQTTGQGHAAVSFQSDGSFMAVWSKRVNPTSDNNVIYGRRFTALGAAVGDQIVVDQSWFPELSPNVETIPGAGYVVTWSRQLDFSIYGPSAGLFQVYGADGSLVSATKGVGTFGGYNQETMARPGISPGGDLVLGWSNLPVPQGSHWDAAFQIFKWDTPPIKVADIAPINALEGDGPITIDLSNYFYDYETAADKLVYTAGPNFGANDIVSTSVAGSLLTITLGENKSGITTVSITVKDERGLTQNALVTVSVAETDNDNPVAEPIPDVVVNEDAPGKSIALGNYFSDPETASTNLKYSLISSTLGSVVNVAISTSKLNLTFLPNTWGEGDITVRATDSGGAFAESVVHVKVNSVNDQPVIGTIPGIVVNENNPAIQYDLRNYVSDVEDGFDSLMLSIRHEADAGVADADIADGILTLTFTPGAFGVADVTFAVTDQDGGVAQRVIPISVTRAAPRQLGTLEAPVVIGASPAYANEAQSDVSAAPDGTYVVTWAKNTYNGPNFDWLVAQRFNADGTPLTEAFDVHTYDGGLVSHPSISHSADGSFVVVWQGGGAGDYAGIFGQMFDPTGTKVGTQFLINTTDTADTQKYPSIAHNPTGGFVVAYNSEYWSSGRYSKIYSRAFDSSGKALSSGGVVLDSELQTSVMPRVDAFSDGRYVVAWGGTSNSSYNKVKVQLLAADGYATGAVIEAGSTAGGEYQEADVAAAPNRDFVVSWTGGNAADPFDTQIYAQRYSSNGSKIGNIFLVNSSSTGYQAMPKVDFGLDGSLVIGWTKLPYGSPITAMYFQAYNPAGNKAGIETAITSTTAGYQELESLTWRGNSGLLATFTQSGTYKSDRELFSREFSWYFPPAAKSGPTIVIEEDSGTSSFDLAPYFFDPNATGLPLTYTYLENDNAGLLSAKVVNGALVLSTKENASGSAKISVRATHASGVALARTISVNVNAVDDPAYWVDGGSVVVLDTAGTASVNLTKYFADFDSAVAPLTFSIDSVSSATPFDSTKISGSFLELDLSGRPGVVYFGISGKDAAGNKASGFIQVTITDTTPPAVVGFSDPYAGAYPPVGSIDIQFSEPINLTTFTWQDLTLTRDGGANLIAAGSGVGITLVSGSTYRISGLGGLNMTEGAYTLTLLNGSVADSSFNKLSGAASVSWNLVPPKVMNLSAYPAPRTIPVTSVGIRLSQAADLATFTWEDVLLTLNSGENLATSAITITQSPADPALYTINIPSALTGAIGEYKLTVAGAGIKSPTGIPYGNVSFTTWTIVAAVPGTPALSVGSEGKAGSGYTQYTTPTVTGTGSVGSTVQVYEGDTLRGTGTVASDGKYNVALSTLSVGAHVLKARALEGAGAAPTAYSGNFTVTVETATPTIANMSAYPTPRTVPVTQPGIRFSSTIDLSTVSAADFTLTRDGVPVSLAGLSIVETTPATHNYTITIPGSTNTAGGVYVLTAVGAGIKNLAGKAVGNNFSTTWSVLPSVVSMSVYATARTTPLTSTGIRFSSPINLATFTWADITLTRNGGANLATSGITIVATADPSLYTIVMPSALTTAAGNYVLTVTGAGISMANGLAVSNNGGTSWTKV
jgi:hypothetical protein